MTDDRFTRQQDLVPELAPWSATVIGDGGEENGCG